MLLLLLLLCAVATAVQDASYWRGHTGSVLQERLSYLGKDVGGKARNVILFVGDGMGLATVSAAGIFQKGEGNFLSWERFPVVGLAKTYSEDKQVADSAATATAFLTGVKTCNKMLGLDTRTPRGACSANDSALTTLAQWAHTAGRQAGVVTTARITHATPAALYARVGHRDWECDSEIPADVRGCVTDIARQLVEELPGRELRVVLGGGRRQMGAAVDNSSDDSCFREDAKNLVTRWQALGNRRQYVSTTAELMDVDLARTDYLMGLFSPGHMSYDSERDRTPDGEPSLTNMTVQAIRLLSRHAQGYFLLVEGARIDMAHHKNYARLALQEAVEMDSAVSAAVQLTRGTDTLIVVTADHSHAMTINGYPDRGSDILGLSRFDDKENTTVYETITYANGPGAKYHSTREPRSISREERAKGRYQHFSPIFTKDETHAGEDVPVYATGPGAELLGGVYEQSYLARALAHAAGIGESSAAAATAARASTVWCGLVLALVALV